MNLKEAASEAAVRHVRSGMAVGLGTGSTADYFLLALGREISAGRLTDIVGVPSSERSRQRAQELGIPLTTLSAKPILDLAVDGADEIAPGLALIKGLGGALLREKVVAQAATKFIVIADGTKVVQRLGVHAPVPVEVVTFEHAAHMHFFESLGARPVLRVVDGEKYVTDNGNYIYDCWFESGATSGTAGIADPEKLEWSLLKRAGVADTGLFLHLAALAIVARESGVEERTA